MGSGIFGWGGADASQLGGVSGIHTTPVEVPAPGLDAGTIKAVAAGFRHSLALTNDGDVWAWGDNRLGQLGDNLKSIGGKSGLHWSSQWGPDLAPVANPVRVHGPHGGFLTNVKKIAAGMNHSLALQNDGTILAWGWNQSGQLGDNTRHDRWVPVQVLGPDRQSKLTNVKAIAAGYHHSLALLFVPEAPVGLNSQICAWGDNSAGQLGDGSTEDRPLPVPVSTPFTGHLMIDVWMEIAAGGGHSLARRADGTVWAWGANHRGQLGNGNQDDSPLPVQVALPQIPQVPLPLLVRDSLWPQIAAGNAHSLAIVSESLGSRRLVMTWGANQFGQLGNGKSGEKEAESQPVFVVGMGSDDDALAVCGGWVHSLAQRKDVTVWAWGDNYSGQLGNGTTTNSSWPVKVQGYSDLSDLAAGGFHNLLSVGSRMP